MAKQKIIVAHISSIVSGRTATKEDLKKKNMLLLHFKTKKQVLEFVKTSENVCQACKDNFLADGGY